MDIVVWNDNLSVGVKVFDDEHKQLVNYVNQLSQALKISGADQTLTKVLTGLVKYTKIHFMHEEDYMALYEYPDILSHKKEHDELTMQVSDFYERYREGKVKFSLELMNFLRSWLINHIQVSDMRYKEFFNAKNVK